MVMVNGEKIKSLGNFITIRELDRPTDPMAVRLFVLQAQYRKPIDFTDEAVFSANTHQGRYFWLPVRFLAEKREQRRASPL